MIMWMDKPYYVNKPGLDLQDTGTAIGEIIKFFPATKYANKAKNMFGVARRGALGYSATEAVNSPIAIEPPTGESVLATEQAGRLEKFQKYLDENPVVARQLASSGQDVAKIVGQAIGSGGDDERRAPIRAVRPRFQPGQVRTRRIGMADGGTPDEGSVLGRKLFIQGGEVDGPGGPKEDLVPIWASDQEYVVSHKGVKNMGGGDFEKGIAALDKINFGKS